MKKGVLAGLGAYLIWGLFPIYWKWLQTVPALQILGVAKGGAKSALERDLFEATAHLMKAAPEKPRVLTPKPALPPPSAKDAAAKKTGGKGPKKPAAPAGG